MRFATLGLAGLAALPVTAEHMDPSGRVVLHAGPLPAIANIRTIASAWIGGNRVPADR